MGSFNRIVNQLFVVVKQLLYIKKTQTLINSCFVSISFQNIQTIYVLLSIVGVVILLIVILCLIPFSESSKKRETAYLQGITIKRNICIYISSTF